LERRDHSGTISCDGFALGREFSFSASLPPFDVSALGGAVRWIEQQRYGLDHEVPECPRANPKAPERVR
jgi:hypothetical protein